MAQKAAGIGGFDSPHVHHAQVATWVSRTDAIQKVRVGKRYQIPSEQGASVITPHYFCT